MLLECEVNNLRQLFIERIWKLSEMLYKHFIRTLHVYLMKGNHLSVKVIHQSSQGHTSILLKVHFMMLHTKYLDLLASELKIFFSFSYCLRVSMEFKNQSTESTARRRLHVKLGNTVVLQWKTWHFSFHLSGNAKSFNNWLISYSTNQRASRVDLNSMVNHNLNDFWKEIFSKISYL